MAGPLFVAEMLFVQYLTKEIVLKVLGNGVAVRFKLAPVSAEKSGSCATTVVRF
jgi:hypothetical protein